MGKSWMPEDLVACQGLRSMELVTPTSPSFACISHIPYAYCMVQQPSRPPWFIYCNNFWLNSPSYRTSYYVIVSFSLTNTPQRLTLNALILRSCPSVIYQVPRPYKRPRTTAALHVRKPTEKSAKNRNVHTSSTDLQLHFTIYTYLLKLRLH
jgi:hypothetical protein